MAGIPAGLALDQCGTDRFNLRIALLLTTDQITDVLAVVGVVPGTDLRLDPVVLLIGQGDGFSSTSSGGGSSKIQWVERIDRRKFEPCNFEGTLAEWPHTLKRRTPRGAGFAETKTPNRRGLGAE